MTAVQIARPLVQQFEGCVLDAYPDPATGGAPWTCGWGATRRLDGSPFQPGDRLTRSEADELLERDLKEVGRTLAATIPGWSDLSPERQGCLISFGFNCGPHFFGAEGFETITRRLRDRDYARVPDALMLYVNPGSPAEKGLRRRRVAEAELWNRRQSTLQLEAIADTWLKKAPLQADRLSADQKVAVPAGRVYRATTWRESPADRGHVQVALADGAGTWLVWARHWKPWAQIADEASPLEADPRNFDGKLSRFFCWGEVFQWRPERVTENPETLERVRTLARRLDELRERFGPLQVTSWLRPEPWNRLAGGVPGSRHTLGDAADLHPAQADPREFEDWLDQNWDGGVGYGVRSGRGFTHVDLGPRRRWTY